MQSDAVELKGVLKQFKVGDGDFTALKDVNLRIPGGEFVAIVGKSGSGKSTLMNMVTGIDRPDRGEIFVTGSAIHSLSENQLARWRGRTVGVIFQFFQLLPTLTVVENAMLPMDFCNVYKPSERRAKAMRLLERLNIGDQADKIPADLSGGQQQRAAIARALANDPPIIVADEPTGNLDSKTSSEVMEIFSNLAAEGKTVLMVTHERGYDSYFNRTFHMEDGSLSEGVA